MALNGIKVIELAGLAPAPFCGMILSDFGARVIRVDKTHSPDVDSLARGKQSVIVDLKKKDGVNIIRRLSQSADVLLEPYRPGVMEKLGLGPEILMKENPRLIYARLTGFGQDGELASVAGHDICYIAISGILSMLGRKHERPYPAINLLGDFAGGGLICALGIVLSLFERQKSNLGQLVDANMVQGSAYVGSFLWRSRSLPGMWGKPRGENYLDGGSAFYEVYETKDGKFMSVGALEPNFFQELLKGLNMDPAEMSQFEDKDHMHQIFTKIFKSKTRQEWAEVFTKSDACVQPVLNYDEAPLHPHNQKNGTFLYNSRNGNYEPGPAPKLSRTPGVSQAFPDPKMGQDTITVLKEVGYKEEDIKRLLKDEVVRLNDGQSKL